MSFGRNWCWIGPYRSVITACSPFNETGECRRAFQGAATGYEGTRFRFNFVVGRGEGLGRSGSGGSSDRLSSIVLSGPGSIAVMIASSDIARWEHLFCVSRMFLSRTQLCQTWLYSEVVTVPAFGILSVAKLVHSVQDL